VCACVCVQALLLIRKVWHWITLVIIYITTLCTSIYQYRKAWSMHGFVCALYLVRKGWHSLVSSGWCTKPHPAPVYIRMYQYVGMYVCQYIYTPVYSICMYAVYMYISIYVYQYICMYVRMVCEGWLHVCLCLYRRCVQARPTTQLYNCFKHVSACAVFTGCLCVQTLFVTCVVISGVCSVWGRACSSWAGTRGGDGSAREGDERAGMVCVCVCVCAHIWEWDREREGIICF
jgi:hypothetical protein